MRKEMSLLAAVVVASVIFFTERTLLASNLLVALTFSILFVVILSNAFRVAHHAEVLADVLGEPYGTLILTGAAVTVEVVMLVILLASSHGSNPTLVRDTIYSAIMLDINGILGITAIIGGIIHREQSYNMDSSNSYVTMILVALGIGMVIPDFIAADHWRSYTIFTIVMLSVIYIAFTRLQTIEHRYFFEFKYKNAILDEEDENEETHSTLHHTLMLTLNIVAIGVLAEFLSTFLNTGLERSGLPVTFAAVLVALISASPEILTAIRAAINNRMQTVVNIALGATLATVLMTIPVVEGFALLFNHELVMGFSPLQGIMVLITILALHSNSSDGRSNALEGITHLALFGTFIALLFVLQ